MRLRMMPSCPRVSTVAFFTASGEGKRWVRPGTGAEQGSPRQATSRAASVQPAATVTC